MRTDHGTVLGAHGTAAAAAACACNRTAFGMSGRGQASATTLLLLHLLGCSALGYPYQYKTSARPRPARGKIILPRGRDVPSDGHAAFLSNNDENAHASRAPPDFEALKHSLFEACSWLETVQEAGTKHVTVELDRNQSLRSVLDACRSLLAEAEAKLPQRTTPSFESASDTPTDAPAQTDTALAPTPVDAGSSDAPAQTLVGAVGAGYIALLPFVSSDADIPVNLLVHAIENQATHSQRLGAFMQLIVQVDRENMRTVLRQSDRTRGHHQPASPSLLP